MLIQAAINILIGSHKKSKYEREKGVLAREEGR